jgi:hypothetical protein
LHTPRCIVLHTPPVLYCIRFCNPFHTLLYPRQYTCVCQTIHFAPLYRIAYTMYSIAYTHVLYCVHCQNGGIVKECQRQNGISCRQNGVCHNAWTYCQNGITEPVRIPIHRCIRYDTPKNPPRRPPRRISAYRCMRNTTHLYAIGYKYPRKTAQNPIGTLFAYIPVNPKTKKV